MGCAEWVFLNYEREDRMYKDPGEGKTQCFWITKIEVGQFKRYLGVKKSMGLCGRLYLEGNGSSKHDTKISATEYIYVASLQMMTMAMKSDDDCFLTGKWWQT